MAFSISFSVEASQGWITNILASGTLIAAIWLMGVGTP